MKKILIVDDEIGIIEILVTILEELNFETITADNGKNGLELFEKSKASIAAVFTDQNMPYMSGNDMAQQIKKQSCIPIVLLDAYGVKLEPTYFDYLLTKPFDIDGIKHCLCQIGLIDET